MVFKTRKIPRHLVIDDDYVMRSKPRNNLLRIFSWAVLITLVAYLYQFFAA